VSLPGDGRGPTDAWTGRSRSDRAVDAGGKTAYCRGMSPSIADLTLAQLKRLVAVKEQIASLETELARILGAVAEEESTPMPTVRKRRLSAKGRAAIAAAARARWAKARAAKAPKSPAKPKRTMSAAARKRMAQVAKARAAGRKTLAAK